MAFGGADLDSLPRLILIRFVASGVDHLMSTKKLGDAGKDEGIFNSGGKSLG
jgi:hypothetical protein